MPTMPNTFVFLHGAGGAADAWANQTHALPGSLAVDLPGRPRGAPLTSVRAMADWVMPRIDEAHAGPVVLVGHSMGGAIAQTIASRRPDWLVGMVLLGSGARLRVLPSLLHLLRDDYPAACRAITAMAYRPDAPATLIDKGVEIMMRVPAPTTDADFRACDVFDSRAWIGAIATPTLIMTGDEDRMTPPKYAEFLHASIAGSQLRLLPRAGHMAPVEQARLINRCLIDFAAQLAGKPPAEATP